MPKPRVLDLDTGKPVAETRPAGYTIDDLSAQTGVPSRTIRFYQAKGALPPPERRGRVAYYNQEHVERLELVAHLQDRGLNLKAIRDLFARADSGDVSVSEWLGLGDQLAAPWTDDRARMCSESELIELLGSEHRPGLIAELVRAGLVRREDTTHPSSFLVPSPGLLQIALRLQSAGIGLQEAEAAYAILRRRIGQAAQEVSDFFMKRASQEDVTPEQIARSLEGLREIGAEAVRLVFAQAIERALRDRVQQGRAVPQPRRSRRRS